MSASDTNITILESFAPFVGSNNPATSDSVIFLSVLASDKEKCTAPTAGVPHICFHQIAQLKVTFKTPIEFTTHHRSLKFFLFCLFRLSGTHFHLFAKPVYRFQTDSTNL
jgi:hypothetical protein